ncbi:MAG: hypothetical protein AAGJ94_10930 [Pseudomonadota bacterium]
MMPQDSPHSGSQDQPQDRGPTLGDGPAKGTDDAGASADGHADRQQRKARGEPGGAAASVLLAGKEAAATQLADAADAFRAAAQALNTRDHPVTSSLVRDAADGLKRAANAVEQASVAQLGKDFRNLAREHPGPVLFGAVVAGIALGRFLKASADRPDVEIPDDDDAPDPAAAQPSAREDASSDREF